MEKIDTSYCPTGEIVGHSKLHPGATHDIVVKDQG
jgi:hypothetical protein